jgi:hypothetical protein
MRFQLSAALYSHLKCQFSQPFFWMMRVSWVSNFSSVPQNASSRASIESRNSADSNGLYQK